MILDFWGSPRPPNDAVHIRLNKPEELQFVCGRRGVLPIGRELPRDVIINIFHNMHPLDKSPKVNKLREMIQRQGCLGTKLKNPLIVEESLCHRPILPLAKLKDFRSNILRHFPIDPWSIPKGCLAAITKGSGEEKWKTGTRELRRLVRDPRRPRLLRLRPRLRP
jgi:hypothetical protein